MNGFPIDINTGATPADSGGTRAKQGRRDGDLRGPQFEQLLLALTAAKPSARAANESSAPSITRKPSVEHTDGPAANPTRCVALNDEPSLPDPENNVQGDVGESDVRDRDISESDIEIEPASEDKTQAEEEPGGEGDTTPRLMVCTFDNRPLPSRPDSPSEESTANTAVIDGARQTVRKSGWVRSSVANAPVARAAQEAPPTQVTDVPVVGTVTTEQQTEELASPPAEDPAVTVGFDLARRSHRGRQNKEVKEVAEEQVVSPEPVADPASEEASAPGEIAGKPARLRGEPEHPAPDPAHAIREASVESPAITNTQAAGPVLSEESPARKLSEPAAKEAAESRHAANSEESPKSATPANVPAPTAPLSTVAAGVVSAAAAAPAPPQTTTAGSTSGRANSSLESTGGPAATPANRLPQRSIPTARASGPAGSSQIDTVKFIQRIAKAMQTAREAGGEIRLRLSPPELGSMKMEVKVQDGTLVAKVETETAQAQSALVDNLPVLKERLAEQGVRIERFDVDVSRDDRGQNGFADRDNGSNRGSQPRSERNAAIHRQVSDPVEAGSPSGPITTPQSINVVA